jgi:hypothetical protein
MTTKGKKNVRRKALEKEQKRRVRAPDYPGLINLSDGERARKFVEAVEGAFEALHQAPGGLGGPDEEGAKEDTPFTTADFRTWADSVEDRMEYMGLGRQSTGLPPAGAARGIELDETAFKRWTQRVWARFAALGQVIDTE